jgi:hypothetical protein
MTDKWDYMKLKSFCMTKKKWSQIKEAAHRMGKNSLPTIHLTRD